MAGKRTFGPEFYQPMLATASDHVPVSEGWVFEPKYDGIRIVAIAAPDAVAMVSRNGIDKARQFPEVSVALQALARKAKRHLVLDGEVVAIDGKGEPSRFEALQGRMHLADDRYVAAATANVPTAFIAFDMLVDGDDLLVDEKWTVRRKRLERAIRGASKRSRLRIAPVSDDSAALLRDASKRGWEGILAKRSDGKYDPGHRVKHWLKIKLEHEQEFVIGGWTDPGGSRQHFGALLLGIYEKGALRFCGHVGTGFSDKTLAALAKLFKPLKRKSAPFADFPDELLASAHFIEPKLVAQVRFNEWTSTGMLRHPAYLGLRDDKNAKDVVREKNAKATVGSKAPEWVGREWQQQRGSPHAARETRAVSPSSATRRPTSGVQFTSLDKVFFPVPKYTKGRLVEFYRDIAPWLNPAIQDRPMVLKRYPNGIAQEAFYQHKALSEPPEGVRVENVVENGENELRYIGGDLTTLLYLVQLGAISTDPWHSRVQSSMHADYSIVDLDPGPDTKFRRVVEVARWVKEELDELGLHAVPKTSGASGIHIVLPLPPGADYEISRTLAELVARRVNEKHPKETTVVRAVRSRPPGAVYCDYLQNIRGKTVASVYSVRAEPYASVSTPLKWSELTNDLSPLDFTIENVVKRVKRVGDLWALGMKKRNRLPGVVGDAAA